MWRKLNENEKPSTRPRKLWHDIEVAQVDGVWHARITWEFDGVEFPQQSSNPHDNSPYGAARWLVMHRPVLDYGNNVY